MCVRAVDQLEDYQGRTFITPPRDQGIKVGAMGVNACMHVCIYIYIYICVCRSSRRRVPWPGGRCPRALLSAKAHCPHLVQQHTPRPHPHTYTHTHTLHTRTSSLTYPFAGLATPRELQRSASSLGLRICCSRRAWTQSSRSGRSTASAGSSARTKVPHVVLMHECCCAAAAAAIAALCVG